MDPSRDSHMHCVPPSAAHKHRDPTVTGTITCSAVTKQVFALPSPASRSPSSLGTPVLRHRASSSVRCSGELWQAVAGGWTGVYCTAVSLLLPHPAPSPPPPTAAARRHITSTRKLAAGGWLAANNSSCPIAAVPRCQPVSNNRHCCRS